MKKWLSHVFTTAGLAQLNLFSSTLGMMVWPGIKMIQTEYRLVSVGVSVGAAYFPSKTYQSKVQACMSSVKGPQKGTQKRKKVKPIWNWWPLFIWTWITATGYRFWGAPYRLCHAGFMSCFKVQGNFLLLCSSSNFVGYSYNIFHFFYIHTKWNTKQLLISCISTKRQNWNLHLPALRCQLHDTGLPNNLSITAQVLHKSREILWTYLENSNMLKYTLLMGKNLSS